MLNRVPPLDDLRSDLINVFPPGRPHLGLSHPRGTGSACASPTCQPAMSPAITPGPAAGRAGYDVGRDQVARLMHAQGIEGARRTKRVRTTRPAEGVPRHPDLVKRDFTATAPNELWVTDLTYSVQPVVMCSSGG